MQTLPHRDLIPPRTSSLLGRMRWIQYGVPDAHECGGAEIFGGL